MTTISSAELPGAIPPLHEFQDLYILRHIGSRNNTTVVLGSTKGPALSSHVVASWEGDDEDAWRNLQLRHRAERRLLGLPVPEGIKP